MSSKKIEPEPIVVSNLSPSVEGERYPAKAVEGDHVSVSADIFKDGHDILSASVLWRQKKTRTKWKESPLAHIDNDRWHGSICVENIGAYEFQIIAWVDHYKTWAHEFTAKHKANDSEIDLVIQEGSKIIDYSIQQSSKAKTKKAKEHHKKLTAWAKAFKKSSPNDVAKFIESSELSTVVAQWIDRSLQTISETRELHVERIRARYSSWYEFFPRSAFGRLDKHATIRDCLPRLDDAAAMGFDVVYLPPVHPIGVTNRKGKNNATNCEDDDYGSPWAIGGPTGGHYDVEPLLGTTKDIKWLCKEAKKRGLEVALDFALNCSPDHPYVKEYPDWFQQRPDGSIKYAENPPKKYQDIYPLDFHCEDQENLWNELVNIVKFWIEQGVRIFRVDNPHTKPVSFWKYLINEIHQTDPDIIFLSEAFTKPKMMQTLAKNGFTQSYTYFTWRVTKQELIEYLEELTQGEMRHYYRGNLWPNTPDILPDHLQNGTPSIFKIRATLASTLSSSWGIYSGYEFCENEPFPGKEEYNDSEKYQLANRDWSAKGIKAFLSKLNEIRNQNPALQLYNNLRFHPTNNEDLLCYSKTHNQNIIVVVVNLSDSYKREGMVQLPLEDFSIDPSHPYTVDDLLHGDSYEWKGHENFVSLEPTGRIAHIFQVTQN